MTAKFEMTTQFWLPSLHPRVTPVERQLEEFAQLPEGWRFGSGGPIADETLARARSFLRKLDLHGFRKINAFADDDRSVMLSVVQNGHHLEITLETDGTISFVHDEGDVELDRAEHASEKDALVAFSRAVRRIWPSYGLSIQGTTTPTLAASRRWPTRISMGACLSS